MSDVFQTAKEELESPARRAFEVTPNDSIDLTISARGLYVGGGGDIKVTTVDNSTVTFVAVPTGTVLPVRVSRVWSTGTTATSMVGLY